MRQIPQNSRLTESSLPQGLLSRAAHHLQSVPFMTVQRCEAVSLSGTAGYLHTVHSSRLELSFVCCGNRIPQLPPHRPAKPCASHDCRLEA